MRVAKMLLVLGFCGVIAVVSVLWIIPWLTGEKDHDERTHHRQVVEKPLSASQQKQIQNARIVILNAEQPLMKGDKGEFAASGLLVRELVRQAVLIAARDELKLAVRDVTLGDPLPAEVPAGAVVVNVKTMAVPMKLLRVQLTMGSAGDEALIGLHEIPLEQGRPYFMDNFELLQNLEIASRKAFVDLLTKAGFKRQPMPQQRPASEIAPVDRLLADMNFIAQFAALRDVHVRQRNEGETPDNLAALVRGYANLGLLTQFYWAAMHKACKARALLYAQRLCVGQRNSVNSLRIRAYALALTGLEKHALDDLNETDAAQPAEQWVEIIRQYCLCDRQQLDTIAAENGPSADLARLLTFFVRTAYVAPDSPQRAEGDQETVAALRECFVVYDEICEHAPLGTGHVMTVAAPQVFKMSLPSRLKSISAVPRKAVDAPLQDVASILIEAGKPGADQGEPSLSVLGGMIRETVFAQVVRRMKFMKDMWSVPVDEFYASSRPLIANHRYRQYLEAYRLDPRAEAAEIRRLLTTMEYFDEDVRFADVAQAIWQHSPLGKEMWDRAFGHMDAISGDARMLYTVTPLQQSARYAHLLLDINPHRGDAAGMLVASDWPSAKLKLDEWHDKYSNCDVFVARVAEKLVEEKHPDAEKWLRSSIQLSSGIWAYVTLAELYKEHDRIDEWKQTMDEYIAQPAAGLGRSTAQVRVASYYMEQHDWETAKPYALAAAETWSALGMVTAGMCCEGLEDWQQAELWYRGVAERYPGDAALWFYFCLRTGHGDRQQAERYLRDHLQSAEGRLSATDFSNYATLNILAGDLKQAVQHSQREYDLSHTVSAGCRLALLQLELNDTPAALVALQQTVANFRPPLGEEDEKHPEREMTELLRQAIQDKAPLDVTAIDGWLKEFAESPFLLARWDYIVGSFLYLTGDRENGVLRLRRCVEAKERHSGNIILAIEFLRRHVP